MTQETQLESEEMLIQGREESTEWLLRLPDHTRSWSSAISIRVSSELPPPGGARRLPRGKSKRVKIQTIFVIRPKLVTKTHLQTINTIYNKK